MCSMCSCAGRTLCMEEFLGAPLPEPTWTGTSDLISDRRAHQSTHPTMVKEWLGWQAELKERLGRVRPVRHPSCWPKKHTLICFSGGMPAVAMYQRAGRRIGGYVERSARMTCLTGQAGDWLSVRRQTLTLCKLCSRGSLLGTRGPAPCSATSPGRQRHCKPQRASGSTPCLTPTAMNLTATFASTHPREYLR